MILVTTKSKISPDKLSQLADEFFGDMVKAVVDVEKGIMFIGGELHSDEERELIESGSVQENLWGINIYPEQTFPESIEFDSMINIRPRQNNRSRGVENSELQKKILEVVKNLLE